MIEDIFPAPAQVMANFDHLRIVTYTSHDGKSISKNWNSPPDSDRIALDTPLADSSSKPRIVVGSDHAGFRAKETIKKYLEGAGYPVEDVGTHRKKWWTIPIMRRRSGSALPRETILSAS